MDLALSFGMLDAHVSLAYPARRCDHALCCFVSLVRCRLGMCPSLLAGTGIFYHQPTYPTLTLSPRRDFVYWSRSCKSQETPTSPSDTTRGLVMLALIYPSRYSLRREVSSVYRQPSSSTQHGQSSLCCHRQLLLGSVCPR